METQAFDRWVGQFLDLAELAHGNGVPEVNIGGRGIVAAVDPQRSLLQQALVEFPRHVRLDLFVAELGAVHQEGHLLLSGQFLHH